MIVQARSYSALPGSRWKFGAAWVWESHHAIDFMGLTIFNPQPTFEKNNCDELCGVSVVRSKKESLPSLNMGKPNEISIYTSDNRS